MKGASTMGLKRNFFLLSLALGAVLAAPTLARAASLPLSLVEGSHLRLDILEEGVEVMQVLHVHNNGKTDYEPQGGLELGLPAGARQVEGDREMLIDSNLETVSILGPFTPGVSIVRLRFSIPLKGERLVYHQRLGIGSGMMHVILPSMPGIQASGREVMNVARHHSEGLHLLVIDVDTSSGYLDFGLLGLPARAEVGRWIALALSFMVLLAGLGFGLAGGSRENDHRERLEKEREAILDELEQLEIDKKEGMIDHRDYASDHEDLLTRLSSILRALEAGEK